MLLSTKCHNLEEECSMCYKNIDFVENPNFLKILTEIHWENDLNFNTCTSFFEVVL